MKHNGGMDEELAREIITYGADAAAVVDLLDQCGRERSHREVDRVQRAILTLAAGDVAKLRHHVGVALKDYRDVLWWAEEERSHEEPPSYEELRRRCGLPPEE